MRHFFSSTLVVSQSLPVATLPVGVLQSPPLRRLVPRPGCLQRAPSRSLRALPSAVLVPSVTERADPHLGTAPRTRVQSVVLPHGSSRLPREWTASGSAPILSSATALLPYRVKARSSSAQNDKPPGLPLSAAQRLVPHPPTTRQPHPPSPSPLPGGDDGDVNTLNGLLSPYSPDSRLYSQPATPDDVDGCMIALYRPSTTAEMVGWRYRPISGAAKGAPWPTS